VIFVIPGGKHGLGIIGTTDRQPGTWTGDRGEQPQKSIQS